MCFTLAEFCSGLCYSSLACRTYYASMSKRYMCAMWKALNEKGVGAKICYYQRPSAQLLTLRVLQSYLSFASDQGITPSFNVAHGYPECLCYIFCQGNECWRLTLNTVQLTGCILGLTQWLCFNMGLLNWQKKHNTEWKVPPLQQNSKCFWCQCIALIYSVYKMCSKFCFSFCSQVTVSEDSRTVINPAPGLSTEGVCRDAVIRGVRACLSEVLKNAVIPPS